VFTTSNTENTQFAYRTYLRCSARFFKNRNFFHAPSSYIKPWHDPPIFPWFQN